MITATKSDAVLILPDGTEKEITPLNGKNFTLPELYTLLECEIIESVSAIDGRRIIVDEEGKLKPNPIKNVKATLLYMKGFSGDYIVGRAIVCKPRMFR